MSYTDATATNNSGKWEYRLPCKPPTVDSLKAENARLKSDIARLERLVDIERSFRNGIVWASFVIVVVSMIIYSVFL